MGCDITRVKSFHSQICQSTIHFFSTIHFVVRWSKSMSVPSFLGLGDFDLEVLRYVNLEFVIR